MEMTTLLTRYVPQLPRCIRHSSEGGLLVPHGDWPRQDNWGVPLRRRFVASAANSLSSVVSAWPHTYSVVAARAADPTSTAKKNLLQHPAHVHGRLFCSYHEYFRKQGEGDPEDGSSEWFSVARNKLQDAVMENRRERTLEALWLLKVFAGNKDYYGNGYKATELLLAALSPFGGKRHGGGLGLDDDVVKESLAVACLLLRNAAKIGTVLCSEISPEKEVKTNLERIRDRGSGGSDCDNDEVRKLANEILTRLPSTPN